MMESVFLLIRTFEKPLLAVAAALFTFLLITYLKHLKFRHRGHPKNGGVVGRHSVY